MNRKNNIIIRLILRFLTLCLMLGWMGVIFAFSEQPGDDSGRTSGRAAKAIAAATNQIFHLEWSDEELLQNAEVIDYPIRKIAHMTEYGILASFMVLAMVAWPISGKRLFWFPLTGSFLYAISDEVHQLYVEGRSGKVTDVLVDTLGATLALLLILCIVKLVQRKREKKQIAKTA